MPTKQWTVFPPGLAAARPAAGTPGRLYYSTDTTILERDAGSAWERFAGGGGGGVLFESYCCVVDQKAQNTAGGGFTNGAWRTRDINTEQADPDGIVALAANQITLDTGTYYCLISAPAYNVDEHQLRLYNATDVGLLLQGGSMDISTAGGVAVDRSTVIGRFTIGASKAIEVQHRCVTTQAANGFGVQANFSNEIYTVAEFWKEA